MTKKNHEKKIMTIINMNEITMVKIYFLKIIVEKPTMVKLTIVLN